VFPEFGELWFTLRGAKILTADISDIFVGAQPNSAALGLLLGQVVQDFKVSVIVLLSILSKKLILSPTIMFVISIL